MDPVTEVMMTIDKKKGLAALFELRHALDDELDLMTADDFETMSKEAVEQELASIGAEPIRNADAILSDLSREKAAKVADFAARRHDSERPSDAKAPSPCSSLENPADDWIVDRPALTGEVFDALDRAGIVYIHGPSGTGKSHLFRSIIRRSPQYRERFDATVLCDCFGLKARAKRSVEQDAVFAQFGGDDDDFSDFVLNVGDAERPLQALIFEKFRKRRGLLVLDHLEALSDASEISFWLDELLKSARSADVKVLIIKRSDHMRPSLQRIWQSAPCVEVDALSEEEVSVWWARPMFERHLENHLTAGEIIRWTGGSPRLIRDFGRFIETRGSGQLVGRRLFAAFLWRMLYSYWPELSRLVAKCREYPWLFPRPEKLVHKSIRPHLIATGALVETRRGRLCFRSPLFAARFRRLMRPNRLRSMVLVGSDDALISALEDQEVISERVNYALLCERPGVTMWRRVGRFLHAFGLGKVQFYVRDPVNAKLWSIAYSENKDNEAHYWKASPLAAHEKPDFALAVQSGRIVQRKRRQVYLPMVSDNGRVSIVIVGELGNHSLDAFERRLSQRALWNFAMAIEPAISLSIERTIARRLERYWKKASYRAMNAPRPERATKLDDILAQAGCSAIIILERNRREWFVANTDEVGGNGEHSWEVLFSGGDTNVLDEHQSHRSRRGLVLDDEDLFEAFPRLRHKPDISVFLWPVWSHGAHRCRLVAFLFEEEEADELIGHRQIYLSMIARQAAHVV